jgi:hypothetical protein
MILLTGVRGRAVFVRHPASGGHSPRTAPALTRDPTEALEHADDAFDAWVISRRRQAPRPTSAGPRSIGKGREDGREPLLAPPFLRLSQDVSASGECKGVEDPSADVGERRLEPARCAQRQVTGEPGPARNGRYSPTLFSARPPSINPGVRSPQTPAMTIARSACVSIGLPAERPRPRRCCSGGGRAEHRPAPARLLFSSRALPLRMPDVRPPRTEPIVDARARTPWPICITGFEFRGCGGLTCCTGRFTAVKKAVKHPGGAPASAAAANFRGNEQKTWQIGPTF